MARLIYTPDIFSLQRIGGVSRYICQLVCWIPSDNRERQVIAGVHLNRHLRRVRKVFGVYIPKLGPVLGRNRLRFNKLLCSYVAAKSPSAVIHQTYYSEQQFPSSHPVVLTVHDMIDELYPERNTAVPIGLKRRNCQRADYIIAVSANTKKDVVNLFNISPDKISVVYHGDSLADITPSVKEETSALPYLLFVGARGDYKNFNRLLEAFASSNLLKNEFRLVTFGGGKFSEVERQLISELGLTNNVRYVTGTDVDLVRYYRNAAALIYPSLYEGFGLPVIEAMGQRCPVICSNPGGSVPEIAGDAAAYFDGRNLENMRHVMEQTLGDSARLTKLRQAGTTRHELFSWEKCARQTLSIYEMAAASRR